MSALTTPPLALYVHFPWCVRKCPYCDFNSYTLGGELPESAYLGRLARDLEAQASEVAGREVISVFLGGGTPSLFSPRSIGELLAAARRVLKLAPRLEVTLEANPGAIERGAFREYRAAGVTRVSLGAQSFDPERLKALGRIHSPAETRRAAEELHAAGLANFNLDLMYALPGQDVPAARLDVAEALELRPAHVSHYQLTIEPGTVFAARRPPLPDEDAAAAMLDACAALLGDAGRAQYEVSAYARPAGLAGGRVAHGSPAPARHAPAHYREVPAERPGAAVPQRDAARIHAGNSGIARSVSVVNGRIGRPRAAPAPFIHRLRWRYRRMSRLRGKLVKPLDKKHVTR